MPPPPPPPPALRVPRHRRDPPIGSATSAGAPRRRSPPSSSSSTLNSTTTSTTIGTSASSLPSSHQGERHSARPRSRPRSSASSGGGGAGGGSRRPSPPSTSRRPSPPSTSSMSMSTSSRRPSPPPTTSRPSSAGRGGVRRSGGGGRNDPQDRPRRGSRGDRSRSHSRDGGGGGRRRSGSDPTDVGLLPMKPSAKPPSNHHDYRGDVRAQDILVEAIESHRASGQRHRVLFPGSDKFEMERMDVWNHDSICTPCLILQPRNSAEVASCVKGYASGVRRCVTENRRTGSKLGIPRLCVAGGRSSWVAMMEGAVVLDLGRMKRVKVNDLDDGDDDDDGGEGVGGGVSKSGKGTIAEGGTGTWTVTVQGGARISDLDAELGRRGLMAVAGTHPSVGVVGCVLGGGFGYASRKHGLMCDNVVGAKIVTADGRVRRCGPGRNEDLYWALRGGGGGVGVVTEMTLKCYPLRNAALLTFDLVASSARVRRGIVTNWARWICGDVQPDGTVDSHGEGTDATGMEYTFDDPTIRSRGAPKEVFSQIVLPTNSSSLPVVSASVDPEVVPQSEGRLEQFRDIVRDRSRRRIGSFLRKSASTTMGLGGTGVSTGSGLGGSLFGGGAADFDLESSLPTCWERVPGLADLRKNKLGASMRLNSKFRMVRYYDELQRLAEDGVKPGNVYFGFKYVRRLSDEIVEVLVQATAGSNSPNNESRIIVTSVGCAINDVAPDSTAYDARDANFVLFVEGRWNDSRSERRRKRERKRVVKWVHWVSGQLAMCDGVRSTAHPEAALDHLPKGFDPEDPPGGHCNFSRRNGRRLREIKKRRDPRNVFSMASRVTWRNEEEDEKKDGGGRDEKAKAGAVGGGAGTRHEASAQADPRKGGGRRPGAAAPVDTDDALDDDDSDDSTDEADLEEEDEDDSSSRDSDEEPPRLHYTSQRNLMGNNPLKYGSSPKLGDDGGGRKKATDNNKSGVSPLDRRGVLNRANSTGSVLSNATSLSRTSSAQSLRSTSSADLESIPTDFAGFPIGDLEASADASEWSGPLGAKGGGPTMSSALFEGGEDSILADGMRDDDEEDDDDGEEYDDEDEGGVDGTMISV